MATDRRRTPVRGADVGWYVLLTALSLLVLFPVYITIARALSNPSLMLRRRTPSLTPLDTQWGAFGQAKKALAVTFMAQAAIDAGIPGRLGLDKRCVGTRGTRALTKKDLLHNDALPEIRVDPETYRVEVNGELATCQPMTKVPLGPLYVMK